MKLTRRQTDQVIVTLGSVWDSLECERDPTAMWGIIMAALEANTVNTDPDVIDATSFAVTLRSDHLQVCPPEPADRDYEAEFFCAQCNTDTVHIWHDSGQERDSSGDWRECKTCGQRTRGM